MNRRGHIIRTSIVGITANLILVAFKALVGWTTGSVAIVMDAVNNLSDALASVITIIGTKLAGKAPDKSHPYGYGRIEYITSITIAVIVLLAGITSFMTSVERIIEPIHAEYSKISLIIIVVAVGVKYILGNYVKRQGRKYHSESLVASGTDAIFDAVISFSTLIAAIVSIVFQISIEGYLGALIAVVIVKSGIEILIENLGSIIGKRVDSGLVESLKMKIQAYPKVEGVYDLILHQYGPEQFIGSVHIEVDDEMMAKAIHRLTREIVADVYINYGIILTIGIYASNTDTNDFAKVKEQLREIIKRYPGVLQMHGFYVESDLKTVSFDLMIDYNIAEPALLREQIVNEIKAVYPQYTYYALLDHDFSS